MTFQTVPDTASFTLIGEQFTTEPIVNTIYVRNTLTPWTATTLSAMAATIGNAWRDQMCPQLSNSYVFDRVEWRDEGAEFGVSGVTEYNTTGGKTGAAMTGAICALARLICDPGAAPRKGHLFISPLTEPQVNGNAVEETDRAAIETALDSINTSITGGGNAWVVVSRYSKGSVPTPPHKRAVAVTNPVADRVVRTEIGLLRPRRIEF
jgi:hypothetical protein